MIWTSSSSTISSTITTTTTGVSDAASSPAIPTQTFSDPLDFLLDDEDNDDSDDLFQYELEGNVPTDTTTVTEGAQLSGTGSAPVTLWQPAITASISSSITASNSTSSTSSSSLSSSSSSLSTPAGPPSTTSSVSANSTTSSAMTSSSSGSTTLSAATTASHTNSTSTTCAPLSHDGKTELPPDMSKHDHKCVAEHHWGKHCTPIKRDRYISAIEPFCKSLDGRILSSDVHNGTIQAMSGVFTYKPDPESACKIAGVRALGAKHESHGWWDFWHSIWKAQTDTDCLESQPSPEQGAIFLQLSLTHDQTGSREITASSCTESFLTALDGCDTGEGALEIKRGGQIRYHDGVLGNDIGTYTVYGNVVGDAYCEVRLPLVPSEESGWVEFEGEGEGRVFWYHHGMESKED